MKYLKIPYNENSHKYFYSCPYYGEFSYRNKTYEIPDCYTATALFIYFQIYYPQLSEPLTNTRLVPLWRYITWASHYTIQVNTMFAKLIDFLCKHKDQLKIPGKGIRQVFTHRDLFYQQAQALLQQSHEWDWVIPHLSHCYPQVPFIK